MCKYWLRIDICTHENIGQFYKMLKLRTKYLQLLQLSEHSSGKSDFTIHFTKKRLGTKFSRRKSEMQRIQKKLNIFMREDV